MSLLISAAHKKEKVKTLKKDSKAYDKLVEEDEQCKQQLSSCEQRDVHARQVSCSCSTMAYQTMCHKYSMQALSYKVKEYHVFVLVYCTNKVIC